MAEIALNLAGLFEQAFGYKTLAFDPQFQAATGRLNGRVEQGASGSPYYAKDRLGQEYYMPVTFTYQENSAAPSPQQQGAALPDTDSFSALKKWALPYPVISITSRKIIVETTLTERMGTVKELIASEDYKIVIRGFLIGADNEFPEQDMTMLRTLYEQPTALSMECPLTDMFLLRPNRKGSDHVVITELKLPALAGVKNVRPYELYLSSDEAFSLAAIPAKADETAKTNTL